MKRYLKGSRRNSNTTSVTSTSKFKFAKYNNNLGYDEVIRTKQEEYAIWYNGESDALLQFYIEARSTFSHNINEFWNRKDYFWAVVGREDEVKCTHSGLPKAMIDTLVNIIGIPEIKVFKKEVVKLEDGTNNIQLIEDIVSADRIKKIIIDNDFYNILKQEQETYTLVIGDGAYFINIDKELSDYPIIEFIDGRNIDFDRKANRIIAVTARKYFTHNDKGYMLTDRRSTRLVEEKNGIKKRIATVEYHLYELSNLGSDEVKEEVPLKTIPDTAHLENLEFPNISCMLAVPCIYRYNKNTERGESFFSSKLDLFDDLDQSKSQASNTTRLSTPVDYIPEGLVEYNSNGKAIPPKRYDRRFVVLPTDRNSIGENKNKIETSQPDLNADKYNSEQEQLIADILTGIMSPATLGVNISIKDNATAQREKEKVTLVTRDFLVEMQMKILKKLFDIVLKVDDYIKNDKEMPGDYEIVVNYPEYANPTFENKLAYLAPVFASGGISAKQYVNELWGDSLSEEEKAEEIRILEQYKNAFEQMQRFNEQNENLML